MSAWVVPCCAWHLSPAAKNAAQLPQDGVQGVSSASLLMLMLMLLLL
jgi:hypothetical protein